MLKSMTEEFTTMKDLIHGLAQTMDQINPELEKHHEQVAYVVYRIAQELKSDESLARSAIFAALLHDAGGVTNEDEISLAEIERKTEIIAKESAKLVTGIAGAESTEWLLERCQTAWPVLKKDSSVTMVQQQLLANAIHLGDHVSLMLHRNIPALNQVKTIISAVEEAGENHYSPELMEIFRKLAKREYFWMDLLYEPEILWQNFSFDRTISLDETANFTRVISRIIDYKSPFTAMHSAGVAASAAELAVLCGMSDTEVTKMQIAGLFGNRRLGRFSS